MDAAFKNLLFRLADGQVTADELKVLETRIQTDPAALAFYVEFMAISEGLRYYGNAHSGNSETELLSDFTKDLKALADYEKTTPSVQLQLPSIRPEQPLIQKVKREKMVHHINKASLVTAIASLAAMVFLIVFAHFAPVSKNTEVATLTDSLNAQWADGSSTLAGTRMATSYTPLLLKEGIVQLRFDNNTHVVIEAPAEFHIIADDQVKLIYGKLFARVPKNAIGFTVSSRETKIVDLGTEFGLSADSHGDLELHVLDGKTLLFAEDKAGVTSMEVDAGSAKKVTLWKTISDIPCNKKVFARRIDSRQNLVWRGQKMLDMTDMVTGGDGRGITRGLGKLSLLTGQRTGDLYVGSMDTNPGFQPAPAMPFVDGVFIPDQGVSEVVSSTGLRFEHCPDTSGMAFFHLSTLRDIPVLGKKGTHSLALFEKNSDPFPATLLLHSNAGITYDLSAIRGHYTGWQTTSFMTTYGFPVSLAEKQFTASGSELVRSSDSGMVDFYILVDGKIRQKIAFRTGMKPQTVQIPLSDQDRFLSLVCTDSTNNNNFDWFVLDKPTLLLEEK